MKTWFDSFDLEFANLHGKGTLVERLGIEFIAADETSVTARMPVDERTKQPAGVLHGGASVTLAETVATWAASFAVDRSQFHCVGMEINANHVRPVSEGFVLGTARALHLGRQTQVWEIHIVDEQERLVCIARMTAAILPRPSGY
ncbi:MAG: hotdog fold thioesterase [Pirellulaceae bacterium]